MTDPVQIALVVAAGACVCLTFTASSNEGAAKTAAIIGLPLAAACYLLTLAARLSP
jgi:mannose/fructose/N-acetylgalactosamine-specific phosphotransferase system component IIC